MRRDMISFGNSENKASKIVLKFSYFLITFFLKRYCGQPDRIGLVSHDQLQ